MGVSDKTEGKCAALCTESSMCSGYEWYGSSGECHLHTGEMDTTVVPPMGGPVHYCKGKNYAWTKLGARCMNANHIGKKFAVASLDECKLRCAAYTGTKTCVAV